MDYEKRVNSKAYIFFDWLYKLLIMNIFTILFVCLIFTGLPAIIAMNATIKKDMQQTNVFKAYFKNFAHYFKKSFLIGLLVLVVLAFICYAFYFYAYVVPQNEWNVVVFQMGIVVMFIFLIILVMLCVNIPLIVVTFPSLNVGEILKTSFYISFRYFMTTLILFGMFILKIIGTIAAPIWLLVGVSLPTLLGIKLTAAVYIKFEKIDLEKMMHQVEEEENE